ncbi:MAG: type II toxin-antitoxin system YafQ family toxin [Oscillospiraceae bacterium]|nr:type II toxin-antitoxin system YafQ family toxin [Oscillospiraceae bacterium]
MSLDIIWTTQFKKDYKRAEKRGYNLELLDECIRILATGKPLPPEYRDHKLSGNWSGYRECHIENDWLLIYRINGNDLVLTLTLSRAGTHSDVF